MNHPIRTTVAALGILVALPTGKAFTQTYPYSPTSPYTRSSPVGPYSRPALSPYLNLLRGGSPAANYYLGVVPEFQRRAAYNQFSSTLQEIADRTATLAQSQPEELLPTLPQTGHPVTFLNYSPYYTSGTYGRPGSGAATGAYGRPGSIPATPPSRSPVH